MKTKSLNFIIPLVVYPLDVMISMGETDEQLGKILGKYINEDEVHWKWSNETATGRFCLFSTNQGLIRLRGIPKSPEEYASLQHEIFHYVMHILGRIGMKWTAKSDEAYAYLIQYLTKEIYNRIAKK
jgi:hypothetical protein